MKTTKKRSFNKQKFRKALSINTLILILILTSTISSASTIFLDRWFAQTGNPRACAALKGTDKIVHIFYGASDSSVFDINYNDLTLLGYDRPAPAVNHLPGSVCDLENQTHFLVGYQNGKLCKHQISV